MKSRFSALLEELRDFAAVVAAGGCFGYGLDDFEEYGWALCLASVLGVIVAVSWRGSAHRRALVLRAAWIIATPAALACAVWVLFSSPFFVGHLRKSRSSYPVEAPTFALSEVLPFAALAILIYAGLTWAVGQTAMAVPRVLKGARSPISTGRVHRQAGALGVASSDEAGGLGAPDA